MKREIPILLTVIAGLLITWAFFAPNVVVDGTGTPVLDAEGETVKHVSNAINSELNTWALVIFSVAFLLGIGNLVRINLKQISAGHEDAIYKVVLLLSLFGFLAIGLTDTHKRRLPAWLLTLVVPPDTIALADGTTIEGYVVDAHPGEDGTPVRVLEPEDTVVFYATGEITGTIDRSAKLWIYNKIFRPLQATMFSLLAFYIASAAFRAFRARSLEATLLLGAGAIVMLGQVPIGDQITGGAASEAMAFLMAHINAAGQRAIIIGATLGVLATGLRIVLGLERSYLSE